MNVELANYLLSLDKYIIENDDLVDDKALTLGNPVNLRFYLGTKDDSEQSFLLSIKESDKKALKISFHHQDDTAQYGILRVDYYSRHKNPVKILDTVPERFRDFAGKYLDDYPGHIHYIVDGYSPLVWAIPLEYDDFPIKNLDVANDIASILKSFSERINLKTKLRISTQMRLL